MSSDDFLSKEEILGGLPAKKARTLLFLIENRLGLLAVRSKRAMDLFSGEETDRELDTAFLEAFVTGREPPEPPTIRDLERFSLSWAHLVPDNPRLRASLAHLISEKYAFTYRDIPKIRASLGLDQEEVRSAFHHLYHQPLASIYRTRVRFPDRVRLVFSRLADRVESLPPFWTAFSLTLTETVGAAILALPIALARVGPVAGVFLLVVFGLMNVVTIGFMAEAITRSGTMRYGNAFLGQVLSDYLGPAASIILSFGLGLLCFFVLQAYYIGFSTTLAEATGIPPWFFTAAIFALGMYYITRESLASTVASAIAVGAVNLAIILFISILTFGHLNPELFKVRLWGGKAFDFSLLELIFGVVLAAYFGHLSICNCGKVVLRRDPSGRSLIWGSMASMVLTIIIYSVWVIAVNGAIQPGVFEGLPGTAFTPLAAKIGPIVIILGSLFVVLGMGMASVHFSLGLFNMVGERLPSHRALIMVLPRRNGRITFLPRGRKARTGPRVSLTYFGLKRTKECFLLETEFGGEIHREEIISSGWLDLNRMLKPLKGFEGGKIALSFEVMEAQPEFVRLRCDTSMAMTFEGDLEQIGISVGDVLDLPQSERKLLNHILRSGEVSLNQAATLMEIPLDSALERLKNLAHRGFILKTGVGTETIYRALVAPRRKSSLPGHIWERLDKTVSNSAGHKAGFPSPGPLSAAVVALKSLLFSAHGRFMIRISPIVIAFLITEWMLYAGTASFSKVLNFVGVIVVPLLGGVFPVLMLVSSRRKGEHIPGTVFNFFGNPIVLTGIYLIFMASLLIYGLFIWQEPRARAAVLVVGVFILVLTIWIIMKKCFVRRTAIELRWTEEKGEQNLFRIMSASKPLEAEVSLMYREGTKNLRSSGGIVENASELKSAAFLIPAKGTRELKILAHRVTADGCSWPLEGTLEVSGNGETRCFDLKLTSGSLLMPIGGNSYRVAFTLHKPSSSPSEA